MRRFIYLFLVVVLSIALTGCTRGGQDPPAPETGGNDLAWLEELNIPKDKLKEQGEIEQAWEVNEDLVLLQQVWGPDYDYYLFSRNTDEVKWIVSFIENARLEKIMADKLFFLAKGGSDCGNFEFPYGLTYDLGTGELIRSDQYLSRGVVFGIGSWEWLLDKVEAGDNSIVLELKVAEGQMLAGSFRIPKTSVNYTEDGLSMRIYNATSDNMNVPVPEGSLVQSISCTPLGADVAVDNIDIFKESFPCGGGLENNPDLRVASVRLDLKLSGQPVYNIKTIPDDQGTMLKYVINFKEES